MTGDMYLSMPPDLQEAVSSFVWRQTSAQTSTVYLTSDNKEPATPNGATGSCKKSFSTPHSVPTHTT